MAKQPSLMSRKPSHRLYRVLGDGPEAVWTPIGAAWPNKDGLGFSITCDAVRLHGRIVLRAIQERSEAAEGRTRPPQRGKWSHKRGSTRSFGT